jgi:cytochrome c-type biogenesis protein CcmH/NrfF|tara:strand:+ start:1300 stop:1524 length:225 start_codon:yes stop_codon:yes gene_type:complete
MIKRNDYIFGFVTAFLLLMMLSASPPTPAGQYTTNTLEEQKRVITQQKDCIEKIQSRQKEIAKELTKIRDMLKK